jgi:hypothetical protein
MIPFRPAALLLAAALAACGSDAPEAGAAVPRESAQPQPAAATSPVARQAPEPAEAPPAEGAPPAGYYECYFHGDYGLQNSSMVSMRIHSATTYEAMEERGRYRFDAADRKLHMETGPLAGRVAGLRESSGKPAIVFVRKDNEVDGKPTLDISDTWCYYEPGDTAG